MRLAALEQALPDEGLAQKHLDVFLRPLGGWQGLQEHHDFLEIHSLQLVAPFHEEGGAHVEVEGCEALVFGLVLWLEIIGKRG